MKLSRSLLLMFVGIMFSAQAIGQAAASARYVQEYNSGNLQNSLTLAKEALKAESSNWLPHYYAGISLLNLGKEKDGVKMLQKAVALNQTSAPARAALAIGYLLRNDKKATEEANAALKIDKKNADANYVLAAMAIRNGSYNVAYDRSIAAIASAPKMSAAYFTKSQALVSSFIKQRGTVLKNESRSEMLNEAATDLEGYLRLEPKTRNFQFYREYIESLRFFAEYYSRTENKLPDLDAAAEKTQPNKTPLKILAKRRAQYTDSARSAGIEGTLELLVGFSFDGTIKHVLLIKPLGYGLDEQAIAAAKDMKFEPETENGVPVSTVRPVSFGFHIR